MSTFKSLVIYLNWYYTQVTSGEVKQIKFTREYRQEGTSMGSKGILVSADDEVVIYGANKEDYSCDAFLGK